MTTLVSGKYSSVVLEEGIGVELFPYALRVSVEKGKLKHKEMNGDILRRQAISTMIFLFIMENKGE